MTRAEVELHKRGGPSYLAGPLTAPFSEQSQKGTCYARWAVQGRYTFKLLAVDVPSAVGGEQRIFLQGDEAIYARGGVLAELRDPFTRVRVLPQASCPCPGWGWVSRCCGNSGYRRCSVVFGENVAVTSVWMGEGTRAPPAGDVLCARETASGCSCRPPGRGVSTNPMVALLCLLHEARRL